MRKGHRIVLAIAYVWEEWKRRATGVKKARGAPRPLMRSALLGPFASVHSLWLITPEEWSPPSKLKA